MFALRLINLMFLLALVACLAGAMAGLIVFAPFAFGGWFLTLLAIVGSQPDPLPWRPKDRLEPERLTEYRRSADSPSFSGRERDTVGLC